MLDEHELPGTQQRRGSSPRARAPRRLNPRLTRSLYGAVMLLMFAGWPSGAAAQDCNNNGIPDACDLDCGDPNDPNNPCNVEGCGQSADCNGNGIPDECDIADCDPNDPNCADCNGNGVPDFCDMRDCDPNDPNCADCNGNAVPDECDIASGTSADCNGNGIPDECDIADCDPNDPTCQDLDGNGIPDGCLRFVDADAAPGGNGLSWATAYDHVQDALAEAGSDPLINQIWVAEGTYMPDGGLIPVGGVLVPGTYDRDATFQLLNEVGIYGGFVGNESSLEERDWEANETILSGDLNGDDDPNDFPNGPAYSDNSYHVVTGSDTDATAVLDGFTISGGNANYVYAPSDRGGGMYSEAGSPAIEACRFSGNYACHAGGGMCNRNGSSPTVIDCTFGGNQAGSGAAMENNTGSPMVSHCTFSDNPSPPDGAAMTNLSSSLTVTDCEFSANAPRAMHNQGSDLVIASCTFTSNAPTGNIGGAIYNESGTAILSDSTFTGNGHVGAHAGGAIANGLNGITIVVNCSFNGNSSGDYGGAIRNMHIMEVINSSFTGNSVVMYGGAILNWEGASLTVINCTFSGNSSLDVDGYGGAVANGSGVPLADVEVINCTFSGNSAVGRGGGIWCYANTTVTNSIFWGNTDGDPSTTVETAQLWASPPPTVNYSLIQGLDWYSGGTGNIDGDPLFVDPNGVDNIPGTEDDNLRLLALSPCIDAADNTAVPADVQDVDEDGNTTEQIPIDLDGNYRFREDPNTPDTGVPTPEHPEIVDMGAYEFQPEDCNSNGIPDESDVDPNDPDGNGQVSDDCNSNLIPDECEIDCNGNNIPDECDIADCEPNDPNCADCNGNNRPDWCDIADGLSEDCNGNRIPDECDIDPSDPDGNGEVSDDCQPNGIPDECDLDPNDGLVITTWIGGVDNWNWTCIPPVDPNCTPHWCPDAIPNNGGGKRFNVSVLDPAAVITLDMSPTIDDLSVAGTDPNNGATIVVGDGSGAAVRSLVVTGTIINSGVFEATDGTRFLLDAPEIDQTGGGTLLATDGTADPNELSILEINGSHVTDGFARTEGVRSEIHLIGGAVLDGVTVDGVVVPDGQLGAFDNTVTNDSTFDVAPGGSAVTMLTAGPNNAALRGDGGRVLLGGEWVALLGSFEAPFTNRGGHTIEGAGVIFGGMTNEGTIRADRGAEDPNDAQALVLSPPGAKVNNGTFIATNGGILDIRADIIGDGNIEASDAGQVLIDGVIVENYSLTVPGGTITIVAAVASFADGVDLPPDGTIERCGRLDVSEATFNGVDGLSVGDGIVTLSAASEVTISDGPVVLCPDTASDPAPVAELHIDDPNSTLTAGGLDVCADGVLDVAGTIRLTGSLTFANIEEGDWWWWDDPNTPATLEMLGGVGVADHDPNSYVQLEIGGEDLGDDPNNHVGFVDNFDLSELVIGPGAHVSLVDLMDNGNRNGVGGAAEALYVDKLTFVDSDGRLNLNELHLYYATLVGDSSQILDRAPLFGDLDDDCLVGLADLAQLLSNYGTASGASYEDGDLDADGDVDVADLAALLAVYGTICG